MNLYGGFKLRRAPLKSSLPTLWQPTSHRAWLGWAHPSDSRGVGHEEGRTLGTVRGEYHTAAERSDVTVEREQVHVVGDTVHQVLCVCECEGVQE